MNNFTKSSGRAYWHSITNLKSCSPGFRKLQNKSMKAVMLLMFFTMGTGALFAQNQDPVEITYNDKVDGCTHDVALFAPPTDQAALATIMNFSCTNNGDVHIELRPVSQTGYLHENTGFADGSSDCAWTYYYVYDVKCTGNLEIIVYTLTVSGGDDTPPVLRDKKASAPILAWQEDLNRCYNDRPIAPTAEEMAALYVDNCSHVKVQDMVSKRTRSKNTDCDWVEINTYTIGDNCNKNYFEVVIKYSGKDETDPVFTKTPADEIGPYYCDTIPTAEKLSWTDNCGETGKATAVDKNEFDCNGGYIDRTWTIEDKCKNTTSFTQKIIILPAKKVKFLVEDYTVNIECADRDNYATYFPKSLEYTNTHAKKDYNDSDYHCIVSGYADAKYTDPDLTLSCNTFLVTYTYEDECNNVVTTITVNIIDTEAPSITTATDPLTVDCDGSGNLADYAAWLANMGGAEASDNCDNNLTWSHDAGDRPLMGGCNEFTGTILVTFFVEDDCGNINKTGNWFTVIDDTAPTVKPAQDFRAVCDGTGNTEQYLKWIADRAGASASDDCDSDLDWSNNAPELKKDKDGNYESIANYFDEESGCSDFTGEITITWYVEDDCENVSQTSATFSVEDSIKPVINIPAEDLTVECDGTLPLFDLNYDLADTESLDETQYHYTTNLFKLIVWLKTKGGAGDIYEACSDVKWSKKLVDWDLTGCYGYITVEFIATDECGNYSSTTATFRVEDTLSPIITDEAVDKDIQCYSNGAPDDAEGISTPFQDWLDNHGGATAYDACDKNLDWTYDYDKFQEDCGNTSSILVVFTATDNCGRIATTKAEFAYIDGERPEFDLDCQFDPLVILTSNTNVDCPADAVLSLQVGNVIGVHDTWTVGGYEIQSLAGCVSDNCTYDKDLIIRVINTTNTKDDCDNVITITFEAEDECGNISKTPFTCTYIIKDDTAPVLTGNVQQYNMSNVKACAAPAAPAESDIAKQFTDNCNTVIATLIDTIITSEDECGWARQFVYEIKDICGNLYDQHVKVSYWGSDQEAPQPTKGVVATGDSGINDCLDNALAANPGADPATELAKFTDNCLDDKDLQYYDLHHITKSDAIVTEDGCKWAFHYVFTVSDDCGNDFIYKQEYSGDDNLEPQLIDPASLNDLNVSEINACVPDLQGQAALINQYISQSEIADLYMECGPNPGDGVLVSQIVVSPVFENGCDWQFSVEYRVYDVCNNDAIPVKITLSGSDQNKPVFDLSQQFDVNLYTSDFGPALDCPANAALSLKVGDIVKNDETWTVGGLVVASLDPAISDDCTPNSDLLITVVGVTNTKDACNNKITVSFEMKDACGNVADDIFTCTYYIIDDTNPTASNPADVVVQCIGDVPVVDVTDVIDEADNCNTPIVTHEGDATDGGFPIENITRSYRVADGCGNYIIVSHNIKVEDTIAPEIECPGDIVVDAEDCVGFVKRNLTSPADFSGNEEFIDMSIFGNFTNPTGEEFAAQGVHFTTPNGFDGGLSDNCGYVIAPVFVAPIQMDIIFDNKQNRVGFNIFESTSINTQMTLICMLGNNVVDTQLINVDTACTFVGLEGPGGFDRIILQSTNNDPSHRFLIGDLRFEGCPPPGAIVNYVAPTSYSDNCDANQDLVVTLDAGLASGSIFPVGDTVVRYKVVDTSGNDATCTFTVTVNPPVIIINDPASAAPSSAKKEEVVLNFKAYPVPFNKDVTLDYDFDFDTDVTIEVYDTKGLLVKREVNRGYQAGSKVSLPLSIQGADQLYYVKMITNRGTVTKKIVSSNIKQD